MKKKLYEAPIAEQMECKVEQGFAGSGMRDVTLTQNAATVEQLNAGESMFF